MKAVLLVDFGSTYTKVTAVDLDSAQLLATAASYTTVQTDVGHGLNNALNVLFEKCAKLDFEETYACSSAAGGLRMMASGLVPELTAEAARQASLGAGAKIIKTYAFKLSEDDADEIVEQKPDIFLLAGGIDGGNTDCIIHNSQVLADIEGDFPIIIAGNRNAVRRCEKILAHRETHVCDNVMPKFGTLNIESTQNQIREVFLRRIVQAKGLTEATELINGILMPTPSAVMAAMELLAKGCKGEEGIGDIVGVDVGGATTDIYSIADGTPKHMNTVYKGLPEPYTKRTVEGDIGMRYSIKGIVAASSIERVASISGISEQRCIELIDQLATHTDRLPDTQELEALDFALAALAVETAVARHAGRMEEAYTMMGLTFVQSGKDLTDVKKVIVTGGSLIHTKQTGKIAAFAMQNPQDMSSLRPKEAEVLVDRQYILAAMGLLADKYPEQALKIMKKELILDGTQKYKN